MKEKGYERKSMYKSGYELGLRGVSYKGAYEKSPFKQGNIEGLKVREVMRLLTREGS